MYYITEKYVLYYRKVFKLFKFSKNMTTIDEHRKIIESYEEDIKEKIKSNVLLERQKIIAFCASEAATNFLALFLHKKNLISEGFNVNHRFFSSEEQARKKFNFDFSNKDKILKLLVNQERLRDLLCYGKSKDITLVKKTIKNYFELKELIEKDIKENETS